MDGLLSVIEKSVIFPVSASYIPLRTTTSPCPPESTTPASLRTGSISGVLESTYSACSIIIRIASSMSSVCDAISAALSEIPLATVRIVPSFGFITALYAVSVALLVASASVSTVISVTPFISLVKPLKSCDKITPELPLAPLNEPDDIALERFSILGLAIELTSLAADIIVRVMLVPVSPSGTGKTLRSLIHSFLDSRFLAPARNIFCTSAASIVLVATIILHSAIKHYNNISINQLLLRLQHIC